MYTEYCVLAQTHEDAGCSSFSSTVHYNHYRSAWYAFLDLMKTSIDFADGFSCKDCGDCPSVVIMDGTSLSFRKDLDFWNTNKIRLETETDVDSIPKGR